MKKAARHCIYCGTCDPGCFEGREHVIPKSFGTFGSQTPTLNCVCDKCNAYFKRELDQILAQDTLEGITRYRHGKFSREFRPQKRLRFILADGEETGKFAGAVVGGVHSMTDKLLPIVTQLQVLNRKTGAVDVFFRDQVGSFGLPEDTYGETGTRDATIYAPSKEEYDEFVEELKRAGIELVQGAPFEHPPSIANAKDEDELTLPVYIEGEVDDTHKRALAKILVNFAARYLAYNEVQKPKWTTVKRYVRFGEGAMAARISNKPFWTGQETDDVRYPGDSINVRIENHERGLLGVIQFYNQITYELLLIEGYAVAPEMEVARRFTPGQEPIHGRRGRNL